MAMLVITRGFFIHPENNREFPNGMTPATENLCTALRGWISLSHLVADRERSGIMMEIYGAMINDYHL
jgi:hypothetical protein